MNPRKILIPVFGSSRNFRKVKNSFWLAKYDFAELHLFEIALSRSFLVWLCDLLIIIWGYPLGWSNYKRTFSNPITAGGFYFALCKLEWAVEAETLYSDSWGLCGLKKHVSLMLLHLRRYPHSDI